MKLSPLLLTVWLVATAAFYAHADDDYAHVNQLRAEAADLYGAGDKAAALAKFQDAQKLMPSHPALLHNISFLAVETGNMDLAVSTVKTMLDYKMLPAMSLARKLKQDLPKSHMDALRPLIRAQRAPVGKDQSSVHEILPADLELVEGVAVNGDTTYYSTVAGKKIFRSNNQYRPEQLIGKSTYDRYAFFGIAWHPTDQLLYATYADMDPENGTMGDGATGVIAIDPKADVVWGAWPLPMDKSKHQIADITIAQNGTVYLSDALGNKVWKIDGDTLVEVISLESARNLQGIVEATPTLLLVGDYGRGIWRLDLATKTASLIESDYKTSYLGIDGMTMHNGDLYIVQNGVNPQRVVKLSLSADFSKIESHQVMAQGLRAFEEPTLITSVPDGVVFVAASQWPKYDEKTKIRKGQKQLTTTILKLKVD